MNMSSSSSSSADDELLEILIDDYDIEQLLLLELLKHQPAESSRESARKKRRRHKFKKGRNKRSAAEMEGEVRNNKQVILKNYVNGFPNESDFLVRTPIVKVGIPDDYNDAVLVRNLYLSCDPYLRLFMKKDGGNQSDSFVPGFPIVGYGVSKLVDSSHYNFKKGDVIWGITTWEEYSLFQSPCNLIRVKKLMCLS